jgi:lipoprotein signal peptidase
MFRASLALAGTTAVVAAIDVVHKATAQADYFHDRSSAYVVIVVALAAAWAGAILATGSLSMALCGGVLAGGAVGNLVSLALWPGVPNPIELDTIVFNLADVFVLSGFLFTVAAALVFALRNRERLGEPVRLG